MPGPASKPGTCAHSYPPHTATDRASDDECTGFGLAAPLVRRESTQGMGRTKHNGTPRWHRFNLHPPGGSRFLRNLIAAAFHTTTALAAKGPGAASLLMVAWLTPYERARSACTAPSASRCIASRR